MISRTVLALVTVGSLSFPALATSAPLTFAVSGDGGLSGPVANFHAGAFWWADITGGVSSHTYDASGFNLLPSLGVIDPRFSQERFGSTLLSSPIAVQEGEALSLSMRVFAGLHHAAMIDSVGFAVLLKDSFLHSVLAVVRPDGSHLCPIDTCPTVALRREYAPPSPGVVTTETIGLAPHFTLGGDTYNDPTGDTTFMGPFLTDITSTVTPGAGTYQLLFGAFHIAPNQSHVGVAVTEVTVPEVNLLTLVGLGLVGVMMRRRSLR